MGGSKSQVVGKRYFSGLMAVIGNRIEQVLNINPDNRGWLFNHPLEIEQLKNGETTMIVKKPNLFGGEDGEGGWVGAIDIKIGKDDQEQSEYLSAQIDPDFSAYPNLSYLVFRGLKYARAFQFGPLLPTNEPSLTEGFHFVSMSGMLKDFLIWVKRTRVRNDGREQWFKSYFKEGGDEIIVCEIGAMVSSANPDRVPPNALVNYTDKGVIVATSGTYNYENSGSFMSQNTISLQSLFNSGDNGSPGAPTKSTKQFTSSIKSHGIVKFRLALLQSAETTMQDLPGPIISVRTWSDSFTIYKDYECLFFDGQFSIDIGQNADQDNDVGISISNIEVSFIMTPSFDYRGGTLDINPIHKAREILTDDTAMGRPEALINDELFMDAAKRIWDEGLGISWAITEKSCKDALDELCYHIEAGLRVNRQTGKYEIILFRDDLLDLDNALVFDRSNIKTFKAEIANADDVINTANVNYYDRGNIKDSSFSISENGLVQSVGHENAETFDFPYFMQRYNAEKVANWKLKQLTTPTWKGSFTTGNYDARRLNRYDVIKINMPDHSIVNLPARVMKISLGDGIDNTVTIDFVEVVPYTSATYSSIIVDPVDLSPQQPQPNVNFAFEMPYLEAVQRFGQNDVDLELLRNPETGYAMMAAIKPQDNSLNAILMSDSAMGNDPQNVGLIGYCPSGALDQEIGHLDTQFAITDVKEILLAEEGSWLQLNDEIMVLQSFDDDTNIITVKRGALDTVPQKHASGILFFWDEAAGVDPTTYVNGEIVSLQALTQTPIAIQDEFVTTHSLEILGRGARPYPPANVKIDGVYYRESMDADQSSINLTWVHRNRLQQTGGEILGFFDDGVSLEPDTTYIVRVYEVDDVGNEVEIINEDVGSVSEYDVDISGSLSKLFKIQINSVRDGLESYQAFIHFIKTFDNTINFIFDESEVYTPPSNDAVDFIL